MKSQRFRPNRAFWIIVFTLLLCASAVLLVNTNSFRNPLLVLNVIGGPDAAGSGEGSHVRQPPAGVGTAPAAQPANPGFRGEGEQGGSIVWSQVGGVLYNLWLVAAITDVVMILQTAFEFIRKKFRPVRVRGAATT